MLVMDVLLLNWLQFDPFTLKVTASPPGAMESAPLRLVQASKQPYPRVVTVAGRKGATLVSAVQL